MRAPLIILLILLAVNTLADIYIYHRARRCHNGTWQKLQAYTAASCAALLIIAMALPARSGSQTMLTAKMWTLFAYLSVYIPKYIAIILDLAASLPLLWHKKRIRSLTSAGIILATAAFIAMWWGALVNRFNIRVNEVTIEIPDLPEEFDGATIAQFSDLHTGTFGNDTSFVSRLVNRINSLHPDCIVFTGDIVNRQADEAAPFIRPLSRLDAPLGVYAILGNHDYGDYREWNSPTDKKADGELLRRQFKQMNIDLLLNTTRWLRLGNDSIALIGVENIGDPPFKTYGSLPEAYPALSDRNTKILLSHNPQHWVDSIADNPGVNIHLTLAGHTHAMQMAAGRVSPAALRYPTWGGLYTDGNNSASSKKLYVNIGSGTVGLPMRIGATPEITLLKLQRATDTKK